MNKVVAASVSLFLLCASSLAMAAQSGASVVPAKGEDGIPVADQLTISKCGACHVPDEKGNMTRISYVRTTPEGWAEAMKRMVRLNGLTLSKAEFKSILKYLATWHGLAPEEAKPVAYMAEHRIIVETIIPNDDVRDACTRCHAFGRPMSWRRTKDDWKLLENFHVAFYQQAEAGFRRNPPRAGAAPSGPPKPEPAEAALDYLSKNAALHTAEWSSWLPRIRAPRITGKWLVSANVPGHGKYIGEMTVSPGTADDEFKTSTTLKSLRDGSTLTRSGTNIIYTGYAWRGVSKGSAAASKPDDLNSEARETLALSQDQNTAEGRWYWGQYQEFGFDVKLTRVESSPTVGAVGNYSVKAGTNGAQIKVFGANFPDNIAPADVAMGNGITVKKIVSHTKTDLVVDIDVAADAVSGGRDVDVDRSILEKAFVVYSKVDYVGVVPESTITHLGSDVHPKGYMQFDAVGFENGADGKPGTADDVAIGPIDVNWKLDEYMATYTDDDTKFVGDLNNGGLFTPNTDGPNPDRQFDRNNYGDVWVTATSKTEKDKNGRPLNGRSYMLVAVPQYQQWDQPEVNQ